MPSYMQNRGALRQGSADTLAVTTLDASGAVTLGSTLAVTGNATVGGTLGVTGAATMSSTLGVTGVATLSGNATVGGTLGVTGASTLASVGVTNDATVGGTLGVTGNSTLTGTLVVNSGSITAKGLFASAGQGAIYLGDGGGAYVHWDGSAYNIPAGNIVNQGSIVVTKANRRTDAAFLELTDAATIAVSMAASWNFKVTLGDNRTLGTPTDPHEGQHGFIRVTQDGTGSRTLAYSAAWTFGDAGAPTLSTTAAKVDVIEYLVIDAVAPTIYAIFHKAA
jgi:fibronectin-binding autotransporter adhesin